jgi:ribonuclease-3
VIRLRSSPYRELEKRLGYSFRKRALLEAALVHRSYRFETDGIETDNQRLEFLGDAVLGLVAAAYIYDLHRDVDEGGLTQLRTRVTCGRSLAEIADRIRLGESLRMGKGEEQSGGRQRPSVLADALEAVLGAAFVDGGLKAVEKIFRVLFAPALGPCEGGAWLENPKGRLQELVQRQSSHGPRYRLVSEEGPAHQRAFTVEVLVNGVVLGVGTAPSRKAAEAAAAREALAAWESSGKPRGAP